MMKKRVQRVHFGPSGLGGVKDAVENLERYNGDGIDACEVAFTYGIYIKKNEDASRIGQAAKKLGIQLSVHAPYYINFTSMDSGVVKASKKRILDCCEKAHYLGAKYVVFHAAYYLELSAEECYKMVKKVIIELNEIIKKNKWNVKLAPETTGKPSQFGSLDELLRLSRETGCSFCIDFAHLLAREGKIDYDSVFSKLKKFPHLHCHFSGIVFGDKGELRHVVTGEKDIKKLLGFVKKHHVKDITIINESPYPVNDSVKAIKIAKAIKLQ